MTTSRFDQDTESTTTVIGLPPPPTTSSTSRIGVQKFNPKLGLTWQAMENTTLRAATFRTITRSVIQQPDNRADPGSGIQPVL